MRQKRTLFQIAVLLSMFTMLSAQAENIFLNSVADKQEAQVLLRKIQVAAQRLNYSGTFVYQQSNQIRTSRITHVLQGKNEIEKLEVLDGRPREYIRRNEEVVCYIPETKTKLIERRELQGAFPAMLTVRPSDLTDYYNMKMGETGRVAGFDCQVVLLEPKDSMRYGYKLWAEKHTGLLLRAQTLNGKNEIVEQISFTQIGIGNIDYSHVNSSFGNTNNWHTESSMANVVNLSDWVVTGMPVGFKKVRELKRMVTDTSRFTQTTRREVSQLVFSDGLAAVSIFIEPDNQNRSEGSLQQGALNVVGKRQGNFWLTIVGEVPLAAISQVANSIELKSK